MRSILLALAFAISVSSTMLAQRAVAAASETQSSRALSAASYLDRGNGWLMADCKCVYGSASGTVWGA